MITVLCSCTDLSNKETDSNETLSISLEGAENNDALSEESINSQDSNESTVESMSETIEETLSNQVLLNADDIYVEYRGIEEHSTDTWIINLYVENNRDSEIYLSLRDGLINKFAITFSNNGASIPANSKYLAAPNYDMIINLEDLSTYGITTIETLDFNLYASTAMFGDLISETAVNLEINKPITSDSNSGLETSSGDVLLDSDDIYVEFRGIEEFSSESWIINLYVENNRNSEIYLSLRNGQINKFSIDFSNNGVYIHANSRYLAEPNFDLIINLEDLEAYGISTIETLDFELHISTEMFGDLISETPVNLQPNKSLS